jgi:hypothetical protein
MIQKRGAVAYIHRPATGAKTAIDGVNFLSVERADRWRAMGQNSPHDLLLIRDCFCLAVVSAYLDNRSSKAQGQHSSEFQFPYQEFSCR